MKLSTCSMSRPEINERFTKNRLTKTFLDVEEMESRIGSAKFHEKQGRNVFSNQWATLRAIFSPVYI